MKIIVLGAATNFALAPRWIKSQFLKIHSEPVPTTAKRICSVQVLQKSERIFGKNLGKTKVFVVCSLFVTSVRSVRFFFPFGEQPNNAH